MAVEQPGLVISLKAGTDLSTKQFNFVKISADMTCTVPTASTDVPIGILQNKPGSLGVAQVMVNGISKLVAGGSLGFGVLVGTDASGLGTAVTSGTGGTVAYPIARVLSGNTAANGICSVLVGIPSVHAF